MPNQFFSEKFGDIEEYFMTDYQLLDQYIGDTLWGWGLNTDEQLGDNSGISRSTPVTAIPGGVTWKSVAGGATASAGIKTDGSLWVWGSTAFGQLGIGSQNLLAPKSTPVTTLLGGNNWKQVTCGSSVMAAIKTDGTLWTWGQGNTGQLGTNDNGFRSSPTTTVLGGTNWKSVSLTNGTAAAIKTDGTLWLWGANTAAQLGTNDGVSRSTPSTTILGGTNWKSVVTGHFHIVAIKTDGTLWTWGNSLFGQLGVNDTNVRSTPVTTILGGNNWKYITAGRRNTAAIKTDGTLWNWGQNSVGTLGTNDSVSRSTPVTTFTGGNNWKYVSCSYHTTAIKTDGTLWVWGIGGSGQLGVNNSSINRLNPVTTILGGNNWKTVTCGYQHVLAITAGATADLG